MPRIGYLHGTKGKARVNLPDSLIAPFLAHELTEEQLMRSGIVFEMAHQIAIAAELEKAREIGRVDEWMKFLLRINRKIGGEEDYQRRLDYLSGTENK